MFVIANNVTTRDVEINRLFTDLKTSGWYAGGEPAEKLGAIVSRCAAAGADAIEINIQQHFDQPEAMECAVNIAQQATGQLLCLSSNNAVAMEAGLRICKRPPIVNYVSFDETRLTEILPLIVSRGCDVIILVSDSVSPMDAREMMEKAGIMLGVAREAGIPDNRILVDPGLIHVTAEVGQRHLLEVKEFLRELPEAFESPVRSVCWLNNASAGVLESTRLVIETTLLPMLAEIGLSAVFMDVLRPENMRTIRLIKVFNNQLVYAESEIM